MNGNQSKPENKTEHTPITVLIVDDEPLARAELCRLLALFDDVEIMLQAVDAPDALSQLSQLSQLNPSLSIDLAFIDINMPQIDGLMLAELLQPYQCAIVFCTAYDQYAVDAFGLNALDYLTKPVNPKRLAQSLQKFRQLYRCAQLATVATAAMDSDSGLAMDKPVMLRDGEDMQLITPNQIEQITSVGNYVKISGDGLDMLVQNTLAYLEGRLNRQVFIRANRQTMVNLQKVDKMALSVSGGYLLSLKSGQTIEVSRRQGQIMKKLISL